jgi:hypothetical protein
LTVSVIQDMHATATGSRHVDLDWRDRGDELGYLLERSVDGVHFSGLVSIGKDGASFADTHAIGNRTYTYRLTAQGCGGPGSAMTGSSMSQVAVSTPKEMGVTTIDLFRSNDLGDDQFTYKDPLLLHDPDDALVTNVTNASTDENGAGVKLELVKHTDATGPRSLGPASCPSAPLGPLAPTTAFNGQTVRGEWKVRAVCISQVLLDDPPARIALTITWSQ